MVYGVLPVTTSIKRRIKSSLTSKPGRTLRFQEGNTRLSLWGQRILTLCYTLYPFFLFFLPNLKNCLCKKENGSRIDAGNAGVFDIIIV